MKMFKMFGVVTLVMLLGMGAAFACPPGQVCADNVYSHVDGSFQAYGSDSLNKDNGRQGANAFADGAGAGSFSANSYGDKFASTTGGGAGAVDPNVGAAKGKNWVAVGAQSTAGSFAGAEASNDGGVRDASVEVHGGVYQNNGAFTNSTYGNWATGGNQSSANYTNSDSDSYSGSKETSYVYAGNRYGWGRLNPWNYDSVTTFECKPGTVDAFTAGAATTGGGTFVYSKDSGNTAVSFGATGNYAVGNDGVAGNGSMATSTLVTNGQSGASTYTEGSFVYSGNGAGAGATYGGGVSTIGNGTAATFATHTSVATGNDAPRSDN